MALKGKHAEPKVISTDTKLGVETDAGTERKLEAKGIEENIDVAIEPKGTGTVKSTKWVGTGERVLSVDEAGKSNMKVTRNLIAEDFDLITYLSNETNWSENTCLIPDTVSFDRQVKGIMVVTANFQYYCNGDAPNDTVQWLRTPWTRTTSPLFVTRNSANETDYDNIVNAANYNATTGKYEGDEITTINTERIIIKDEYVYIMWDNAPDDTVFRIKRHI